MIYKIDGIDYEVEIIRKGNKNTYVRVSEDLKIKVTTNYFSSKNDIKSLLDRNIEFLRKVIDKRNNDLKKKEEFYYLGNVYDVIKLDSLKEVDIVDNKIYIPDNKVLDKWLKKEIIKVYEERLKYNYSKFTENIPYPKLKVRYMKTRWGVCNRKNLTITLNSTLIRETLDKIDYVIIHELSHLVHFNHSANFWLVVGKYCPQYKKIRKELKE